MLSDPIFSCARGESHKIIDHTFCSPFTMWNDAFYLGGGEYNVPAREYHRMRQQEELRRLREAEQAYRQKMVLRQMYEKEMARRRKREEDATEERRRALKLEEGLRERREMTDKRERRAGSHEFVLGNDGYLYRIPLQAVELNEHLDNRSTSKQRSTKPSRREASFPRSENVKTNLTAPPLRPLRNAGNLSTAQGRRTEETIEPTRTLIHPMKSEVKKKRDRRLVSSSSSSSSSRFSRS